MVSWAAHSLSQYYHTQGTFQQVLFQELHIQREGSNYCIAVRSLYLVVVMSTIHIAD
jgi:hypothetical protein